MSFPTTRPTLLSRMRKGDHDAWIEFSRKYTALAIVFYHRLGLSEQDAEDLWQEVLLRMTKGSIHTYRSDRGRFRSWLMGALRRQLTDWHRKINARKRGRSVTVSGNEPRSREDPEGATRFDELEDQTQRHYTKKREAVQESLEQMLCDFPDEGGKRAYLDWFWNDDDLADERIASRHGLQLHQLRYLRQTVEAHLRKRWEENP